MRTVGLLLVSALMVVPVATANHLVIGFRRSMLVAMGLGVLAAVSGTVGSFEFDTAPGALIVVIAIGLFALSWPVSLVIARRHAPAVELMDVYGKYLWYVSIALIVGMIVLAIWRSRRAPAA